MTPGFAWSAFLGAAGAPTLDFFNVSEPKFLAEVDKQLKATSLDTWKAYLRWQLINARASTLTKAINEANFGGRPFVTCYTCHRGGQKPKAIPSLAVQYGEPPPEDPDEIEPVQGVRVTATADQILDKYLQALGGAQRVAAITSLVAKGTYKGYSAEEGTTIAVDIYAKSPMQRSQFAHTLNGDLGTIDSLDADNSELTVLFEGKPVVYGWGELDHLVPAYACTIHKSQGSEYPAVIIPLHSSQHVMLARNLLYTGITRGKKLVVLVGTRRAIQTAVERVDSQQRLTRLASRLQHNERAN